MAEPDAPPRWHAMPIGPGGLPAADVRPSGPGAPWAATAPVFGLTPEPLERAPVNRTLLVVGLIVVALGLVVALGVWMNNARPLGSVGSSSVAVGDCLSSSGQRLSGVVSCTDPAADFSVVGRHGGSSDASDCSATPSDVVVVGTGPTVLCLDYVATVGQCLFAGDHSTGVGKVSCASTETGVLKVTAILRNTIDPSDCPSGTQASLVHRYSSQVLCLAAK
ncbi:hypothetical protein SAMN04515671_0811 [Nakamurella panacisegetis]|uniref:Uncharacterized protein n=1 Tax=Nakamurella panacisegetis TaxID=1090615 RepID=A0A1H0J7W4_9ACTN|nr:hypothetical protein [Nakamurella panacisegetis]SDO39754.1 hypothetical protein SAMN04515671_0811 [Nakamurella panacisegetis]